MVTIGLHKRCFFVVGVLAVAVLGGAAESFADDDMLFPAEQWQEATPESQSLDSERLAKAIDYLKRNSGRDGVRELVIVRNGRLVWQGIGMHPEAWDWGDYAKLEGRVVNGGAGNASKHIVISAREFARFGHLFLNKGNWNGRQLIDAGWIEQAPTVQVPKPLPWAQPESLIDGRGCYGFNWWVNGVTPEGELLWPGAPPKTYAASGHNNNKLFVIPEWNMVIVRLGLDEKDGKIPNTVWSEFVRLVGASQTDNSATSFSANTKHMRFKVHEIARPTGVNFGQTSAVDVDRDEDLDFISGHQFGDVFWFENQGNNKWLQHLIGDKARTDVGGVAFDVDGDDWIDQVSGGTWYRNPGNPRTAQRWQRFENGAKPSHDNLATDIDGDGKPDLVSILDKAGVYWYEIPQDPTQDWIEHKVLGVTTPQCHGGIAAGDIDGDGDIDIARIDRWLENADGKGETWIERPSFDFGKVGPWGIQTRALLIDVDQDGDLDLIQAEGDVLDGRVAWFENAHGDGKQWVRHLVKQPGHKQDFHSMCVADFDNDGDVDIFSGGGPLTEGEHVWFVWENTDGKGRAWTEHVVQRGVRTHESVCGDVDGDGDIDILTKPWRDDLHVLAENLLESPEHAKAP